MLTKSWATNKATGSTITLSVVQDKVNEGDYAMKFAYNETSDGWAGATISKEVSWAECDALSFWTIPDGNLQKTVIQITANGNVYEYYMNLNEDYAAAGTKAVRVTIPFAEFVARDITGNPAGGLVEDKGSITSFGLWVNAIAGSDAVDETGMVSGTIYYDSITAVSAGLDAARVELAEDKPEVKPEKPSIENGNTSSQKHDANNNASTETFVDTRVLPSFTDVNGKKVSGWENVVTAAYELAELTADRVPLANAFETETDRLSVNINAMDVTELVIPLNAIQKMVDSGADYNIFMGAEVITLTNEILKDVRGSLDLKLYERVVKEFGEGFDAMFISSRTRQTLNRPAYMNIVLDKEKTGKLAYIYQVVEEKQVYEFQTVQAISEIGTVCVSMDDYASCLILY